MPEEYKCQRSEPETQAWQKKMLSGRVSQTGASSPYFKSHALPTELAGLPALLLGHEISKGHDQNYFLVK